MKRISIYFFTLLCMIIFIHAFAFGSDLTLTNGGRVFVELITSDAAYHNTLSLDSTTAAIATNPIGIEISGCAVEVWSFGGVKLLSEKTSQHGCRVELDADNSTPGNQPFSPGATLSFNLCAVTDGGDCGHVWSSNAADNSDGKDHVRWTSSDGGNYNLMKWEDQDDLGDEDFNDLIAVVRIAQDTDGDGLWDDWENQNGIDTDGDGSIESVFHVAPDVNKKDIYLEIDYMDCSISGSDCDSGDSHSHILKGGAQTAIVNAFANHNINLHIDVDDAIPHQKLLGSCSGDSPALQALDEIKKNHFDDERRFAYHYVVFAHQLVDNDTKAGCAEVYGNDVIVALGFTWSFCQVPGGQLCPASVGFSDCAAGVTCGGFADQDGDGTDDYMVGMIADQATELMHELGHNFGLQHGGDEDVNYKPNYLSVMNYYFSTFGIPPDPDGSGFLFGRLDYSGQVLDTLDERSISGIGQLNENDGINIGTDITSWICPDGTRNSDPGNVPLDWNCNGSIESNVTADINGDSGTTELTGYDDWSNLKLDFQASGDFEDGVHHSVVDLEEPSYGDRLVFVNKTPIADAGQDQTVECTNPNGTTVTLNASASYDPEGDSLTYTWYGPYETLTGEIVQMVLPLGQSCIGLKVVDATGGTGTDEVCITIRDTTPPDITCPNDIDVECNIPYDPSVTGNPIVEDECDSNPAVEFLDVVAEGECSEESTIMRTWSTTDASGYSNDCLQVINVVDTTAPVIACNAPSTITPVNAPISFAATASDNCDGVPSVEITAYDCSFYTKKDKVIDKKESCVVDLSGDTITITDSGGVGDNITWTINASDNCGNLGVSKCTVPVINPAQ